MQKTLTTPNSPAAVSRALIVADKHTGTFETHKGWHDVTSAKAILSQWMERGDKYRVMPQDERGITRVFIIGGPQSSAAGEEMDIYVAFR